MQNKEEDPKSAKVISPGLVVVFVVVVVVVVLVVAVVVVVGAVVVVESVGSTHSMVQSAPDS